MKKKELFNRLTAVSMAAMMTVTMLPANAFASEIDFTDDGQEVTAEVEAEDDSSQEADDADIDEKEVADEAADEISIAEDNEEVSADEDYEDFSDELEAAGAETDDAIAAKKKAAEKWLEETYITGTRKLISNGGTGVTKSTDGLSYSVGLKTNGTGNAITSIRFFTTPSSDFKTGLYAKSSYLNKEIKPSNPGSISIKRPSATEGAQTFDAVLRVFDNSADITDSIIDDENQAADKALASITFKITIEAEDPEYTQAFTIQNSKTKELLTEADVVLKKGSGYSAKDVAPSEDGTYKMENGSSYTVTVKKTGYNDYKEEFTFTGDPKNINSTKVINMKPVVERTVSFKIVDENTGEEIPGAAEKLQVKEGYSTTLKAENDGTYKLTEDKKYNYSVSGIKNYKNVSSTDFTVTENDSDMITIPMEVDISEYKVTIQPKDGNTEITSAAIEVNSVEIDWDDEETREKVDAQADGTYLLRKGTKYEYEIKADGYKAAKGSFTPSGNDENITLPVQMVKDAEVSEADQKTVDDLKTAFNSVFNMGKVRPKYAAEKNVVEFVKNKLAGKADISGVNIALVSSDDLSVIGTDGTIHYRAKKMNTGFGINSFNVETVFRFELNGAVATVEATTQVGWDCKYFNNQMQAESEKLSWNMIKGSNEDAAAVTTDLSLPQCMSTSAKTAWSEITWESSDPEVITFEDTGYGALINPKKGVIHPRPDDTEVTLTATFKANDNLLNGNVESVDDFATYTREFKITVVGTHIAPPTKEELTAILDKYYTVDSIKDFVTDKALDLSNCQSDLKLPRYTRIKDDDGNLVFNNKEITVTSENKAISIPSNSYRAYTDVFYDKDITGDLVVTFTRQGVTVEKRIPVTVKPLSEEALDAEVAMMEQAKLHYFDGINDRANVDKDTVKENLHAFKEMTLDAAGKPVWVYNVDDVKGTGIIVDDMFDDSWIMEGAGYNKFKSSNQAVIAHDNLLVNCRETDEEITISSVLSSERYGVFAKNHPENTKLQKLYKQPVSVTVTVKGTKAPAEGLADLITSTEKLLGEIKEGKEPGQYPEGTKDKLQAALTAAKEVQAKEDATDAEREQAIKALKAAVKEAEAAQNVVVADVTVRVNQASGQLPMVKKLSVKATTAESYGYVKPEEMKNKVTAADAFYAMHAAVYGEDFEKEPEKYISIGENGWINVMFGKPASSSSYYVNNIYPVDENGVGTVANNTVLKSGDELSFFFYSDTKNWSDKYLYFKDLPSKAEAKVAFNVTLFANGYPTDTAVEGAKVALKNTVTGAITEAKTNAKGVATLKADQAGTYQIYVSEAPYKYYVVPSTDLTVAAHTHSYTWKTVSKATVFQPEKQEGTCSVCGEKSTRTVGNKLTATIKLNAKSIKLQKKQTTKKIKVTMANGDYVKSWKSSNKKIVTVNKNGVIKAGKKTGKAKITVTLASGKKATLKVKVQKAKVTTTKITGLKSKVTIKKGEKLALKANLKPLTTQNKVTYKSSNKKVATVNKKGVITAKKKGTVKITVKSGKKTKVIKVTVK
nr:Ig-like domain-containing protein [uncultured Blautia sp.]